MTLYVDISYRRELLRLTLNFHKAPLSSLNSAYYFSIECP